MFKSKFVAENSPVSISLSKFNHLTTATHILQYLLYTLEVVFVIWIQKIEELELNFDIRSLV